MGRQIKAIEAFESQAVKNAQETKGAVDRELVDLEKTLKNIEEARPFEDLTVVCGEWLFCMRDLGDWTANVCCRMRLLLLGRISTSVPRSLSQRVAGLYLVTR